MNYFSITAWPDVTDSSYTAPICQCLPILKNAMLYFLAPVIFILSPILSYAGNSSTPSD